MKIEFFIPWKVVGKQSVRRDSRKRAHFHGQPSVEKNAATLTEYIRSHALAPAESLDEPLEATYRVVYPYLKKHKKQEAAGMSVPKETAPDFEQLGKQIGDVLEFTQFFVNDARIAMAHVIKEHGPEPGVHVTLATMAPQPREER